MVHHISHERPEGWFQILIPLGTKHLPKNSCCLKRACILTSNSRHAKEPRLLWLFLPHVELSKQHFLVKDQRVSTGCNKKLCNSRVIRAEPVVVGSYFFDTLPYRHFLKNCPTTFHPKIFFRTCPLSGRGKAQFVLHEVWDNILSFD